MGVKKGESQKIDERAVIIFKDLFSGDDWTTFDIGPDWTGIDQRVEIVEDNKHTSKTALIQIKGHKRLIQSKRGGSISQKIEIEHLDYYVKTREPVFLVVIDVEKRHGYWVFIQKYERTALKNNDWRARASSEETKHPTISIRVPTSNLLTDKKQFRAAIEDARGYMARLSIHDGLRYGRESYEQLDSRFRVFITATERGENIRFDSISDVSVDITFGESFCSTGKLHSLLGRGVPVKITPGDIEIKGSMLLETIFAEMAQKGGLLRIGTERSGHLSLIRLDSEGNETARQESLPCTFEGGSSECRFVAKSQYGLLNLSGTYLPSPLRPGRLSIAYNLEFWKGRPILNLPNFDMLFSIFGRLAAGERIRIESYIDGDLFFTGSLSPSGSDLDEVQHILDFLEVLEEARSVARRFGVNPRVPHDFEERHAIEIETAYRLLLGQEIIIPRAATKVVGSLKRENASDISAQLREGEELGRLIDIEEDSLPFLETSLPPLVIERHLTSLRLSIGSETPDGEVEVSLLGTEETRLVLKQGHRNQLDEKRAAIHKIYPEESIGEAPTCGGPGLPP